MRHLKIRRVGGDRGRQPALPPVLRPPTTGPGSGSRPVPARVSPIHRHGALLARLHAQGLWGWPGLAGRQGRLLSRLRGHGGECCMSVGRWAPLRAAWWDCGSRGGTWGAAAPMVGGPRRWRLGPHAGVSLAWSCCPWVTRQPGACPAQLTQFNRNLPCARFSGLFSASQLPR